MVQCYSTGDGNVSSYEGTLAPLGEYDWTCASFGPLKSTTETAIGSVQPFLHSLRQKAPILYNGRPYPPELLFLMGDLDLPCNTWRFGPMRAHNPNGTSISSAVFAQMTAVSLYWFACSPSKLFLPMLASGPHVMHGSLGPTESGTQMAAVCAGLTSVTDWQSDRQTDRPRYSVRGGVIMCNYVGYGKAMQSFHVSTNNVATIESLPVRYIQHLIKYVV